MSASASASASPTSDTPLASSSSAAPSTGSTVSSSLYLFTFLITIIVLGLISAALLTRAYYVRRRFHRRVEEAIRTGQALPPDAAAALGLNRPNRGLKKEKKIGLMPTMWEAEMWKDEVDEKEGSIRRGSVASLKEKAGEVRVSEKEVEDDWDELTPLAMIHFPPDEPTPPPNVPDLSSYRTTMPRRQLLRSLFSSEPVPPFDSLDMRFDHLHRTTTTTSVVQNNPALRAPPEGTDVVLGVLIALPTEEGKASDRWSVQSAEDEHEVPEVCLGVMQATVEGRELGNAQGGESSV